MVLASKGTIINIGSVAARVPMPFSGIYNISKAALEQLSRQMRVEMEPLGVKIIHVGDARGMCFFMYKLMALRW